MTFRFAAICAGAALCAITPVRAGVWNYGCKGSLDDIALMFDRNSFLLMPKDIAKGDILGLSKGEIFTFDAADNNSGFEKVMKFARAAFPDQQIVLTETSSKKISEKTGHVGTREKTTALTRKVYHYKRLGWEQGKLEADITMDCIEYMLTAP